MPEPLRPAKAPYPGYPTKSFVSPDHALAAGMVLGLASKYGLKLAPVMDADGGYTNRFEIVDEGMSDHYSVFITVEPPVEKPF